MSIVAFAFVKQQSLSRVIDHLLAVEVLHSQSHVDAHPEVPTKRYLQNFELAVVASVKHAETAAKIGRIFNNRHLRCKSISKIIECLQRANQRGQVRSKHIWKVVKSRLDRCCSRKEWQPCLGQRRFERKVILDAVGLPPLNGRRPSTKNHSDSLGESCDLGLQQTPEDPRTFLSLPDGLAVLVRSNLSRQPCDLSCSTARPPSQSCDQHGHQPDEGTGDGAPARPERRALNFHRKALSKSQSHPVVLPFVLEPILP